MLLLFFVLCEEFARNRVHFKDLTFEALKAIAQTGCVRSDRILHAMFFDILRQRLVPERGARLEGKSILSSVY